MQPTNHFFFTTFFSSHGQALKLPFFLLLFFAAATTPGWEMTRAGAIARQVIDELESLGCDTMEGCPDNDAAREAFAGRSLSDYYTEGYGSGLSYQELEGKTLVTTSAPVLQQPEPGNHYAP
jgi:hypothetical protein